jgi:hypothetical protein
LGLGFSQLPILTKNMKNQNLNEDQRQPVELNEIRKCARKGMDIVRPIQGLSDVYRLLESIETALTRSIDAETAREEYHDCES